MKNTTIGIKLVQALAEQGIRIFTTDTARTVGAPLGITPDYIHECLYHLKKLGWVIPLRKGLFALPPILLAGSIVNEYEVAMAIVEPAAISHWSALHTHQLTQQTPHTIFVLTVTHGKKWDEHSGTHRARTHRARTHQKMVINGIRYHVISTKQAHYFGVENIWVGEAQVHITDLERTLLDCLTKPKFCGGFAEVIEAYHQASGRMDVSKLIAYAHRLGDSAVRRIGWMLEYIGVPAARLTPLHKPFTGYVKLNVAGGPQGRYKKKWGIIENL